MNLTLEERTKIFDKVCHLVEACDNGPELTSRHFLAWCVERQIELVHIQPGKPAECAGGVLRTAARRVFDGELVPELVRRAAQDRGVEDRVQRRASAQQPSS
jgi:hypothetical protein